MPCGRRHRRRHRLARESCGSTTRCESLAPSPVVRLNRAVAVSMVDGPEAALAHVDGLAGELVDFRPLHAVRAELLEQLGETDAAAAEFLAAAELPGNEAEASVLGDARTTLARRRRSGRAVAGFADLVEDPVEILDAGEIYADLAFSCSPSEIFTRVFRRSPRRSATSSRWARRAPAWGFGGAWSPRHPAPSRLLRRRAPRGPR